MRFITLALLIIQAGSLQAATWSSSTSPSTESTFSSSANVFHGLWIYKTTNGSSLFYHSSNEGQSFSSKASSLFTITDFHIDGAGNLYTYDESNKQIYSSSDSASSWNDLNEVSAPTLSNATLFASNSDSLWIEDDNSISKVSQSTNTLTYSQLWSQTSSFPSTSLLGEQVDVVYIQSGQLQHARSTNSGSTWNAANTILSSATSTARPYNLYFRNSLDGHFLYHDGSNLTVYSTIDGGSTWTASAVTSSLKSSGFFKYKTIRDLETIVFETSSEPIVASRASYDKSWQQLSVSSWSGNIISASVHEDGKWFIFSDQQKFHTLSDPFVLFPLESLSIQRDWKTTRLNWPYHPLADNYQVAIDGVTVATVSLPPYEYTGRFPDNSTLTITPVQSSTTGQSVSTTHQIGETSQLEYLVEASSTTTGGFKMLSFPASAYITDREENLSPLEYFERYLGAEHDSSIWRLGRYESTSSAYVYGTDLKKIESHDSYWLISKFNIAFKAEIENPQASQLLTRIRPGWNMIATPYANSTDWKQMEVYEGLRVWTYSQLSQSTSRIVFPELWEWNGSQYALSETLEPGKGYWLKNNSSKDLMLVLKKPSISKPSHANYTISRLASGDTPPDPPTSTIVGDAAASSGGGGGCLLKRR